VDQDHDREQDGVLLTTERPSRKPVPSSDESRLLSSVRRASFAMCVVLLVQYAIGVGVNLFVTLPRADHGTTGGSAIGRAISNGPPAVAIHAVLGVAIIAISLAITVRAAATRHRGLVALGVAGFLALVSAAFNGARFVGTGQNGASFTMALAWAVAVLCYLSILFITGRARVDSQ
jgi:membrane-associated PAP2 superfamily phosphatase